MMGFSSVKTIKQKVPGNHIPVFIGDDRSLVNDLIGAGVGGVVFKTSGLAVNKAALAKVLFGRRVIPNRDRLRPRPSATPQPTAGRTKIDLRKVRRRLLLQGRLED
ncbi:hypothetical protein [Fuscovulum ytuae]|uniref:Uncharacterized protein n=1 Tax=Fuscovulum ytuae TaxID=3042299 RepID=A0ABY8Q5G9_9RHOB|nr:hypothetical protein [Fuscovulum sp. YMD61]WGV15919.1 hypothetical protein QF092_16955 [Fuscovulum sp. YMD61]